VWRPVLLVPKLKFVETRGIEPPNPRLAKAVLYQLS
jgi:hypothetical protein